MKMIMYGGQEITVTKEQAAKLAELAGLVAVQQPGGEVYVSSKGIETIVQGGDPSVIKKITGDKSGGNKLEAVSEIMNHPER